MPPISSLSSFVVTLRVIYPKHATDTLDNVALFSDVSLLHDDSNCLVFVQCTTRFIALFKFIAQLDVEFVIIPVFQHLLYCIHAAYVECFL